MEMLLIMVVFIGLMYVLMVLPQKKKMDAQKKMLGALQPGARVMLNTGMFGTIRAIGDQQMVVELAPGVEVTVLRQAVMRAVTAAEEEFEYSDEAGTTGVEAGHVADAVMVDAGAQPLADQMLEAAEPTVGPGFEPVPSVSEAADAAPADQNQTQAQAAGDEDRPLGR